MEQKNNFSETWVKISGYLKQGVSMIPVRDRADSRYPAKCPYSGWKKYQDEIISEAELFQQLEKYSTTATAFVCGRVSGNMEAIDVDTKNWLGIDVMLFDQIEKLMPDVWSKLRIHSTPSGGKHIIYRISDHSPDGNKKLAWKADAKEAALETRGEAGIILSDSSLGYTVFKDNPIPTITWVERCSLFAICESFNEKRKIEAIKPRKEQSEFYDEDPFQDYNMRDEGNILTEHGWKVLKQNNQFIWYTRPGKTEGVSASFNKEKKIYYIFTSSTGFEPSTGYFPSMVLSKLVFNGDNKDVYRYLVENGYGKVNRRKELKYAENYARNNDPLPNNFSPEAKKVYEETATKIQEAYPFGVFIKHNEEDEKDEVSREALYTVAGLMGFRVHEDTVVRIEGYTVSRCTEREFYDIMKAYIKHDDPDELEKMLNIWEKFIQKNGDFTMRRLPIFDNSLLLKDDRNNAYQFFSNCWVHVTAQAITTKDYSDLDKLVFKEQIRDREFRETDDGGIYQDYLEKAINYDEYVACIIGYLCHNFKDETTGYIPVLTEQCEDPSDGGGSGKNVFCNLFKNVTTFVNKNCSGVKQDEKFFQMWTGQRILALSDLPEHFDFGQIKEAATGSLLHKRLFKDEKEIPVSETPKIVCQTNYSVEIKDGGIKRRVRLLEFTDFFTQAGGIDTHYGKHFPHDWTKEDWLGFDNTIIASVKVWLEKGLKIDRPPMTASGWAKQFKQTFGPTIADIIDTNIKKWIELGCITKEDFAVFINQYYTENNTPKHYQPSSIKINKAIETYCKHYDIIFEKDYMWSENNIKYRGRRFGLSVEAVEKNHPF